MKKTLVAIAALAAFGAQAQSSATLYGTLDMGYGSFSSQMQGEAGAIGAKFTQKGLMQNNFDSSRWGFTTTEDIGGGLKAGATVESWIGGLPRANFGYGTNDKGLSTAAQTQSTFSNSGVGQTQDATKLGDRLLFVNVISGANEVRLGTQSSFTRDIVVGFQADTSNNVGNLAANDGDLAARYGQAAYLYTGKGYGFGAALSNNVRTQSDVNQANTSKGFHLKATGENGPLAGGVAYSNVLSNTVTSTTSGNQGYTGAAAVATAQLNSPAQTGLAEATASPNTKVTAAAVSYDLGVVKLFGVYGKVAVTDVNKSASTSQLGTRTTENVGVRYPYGATGSFAFAQYSTGKIGYNTSGTTRDGDWTGYTVGVKNYISKRTYAYLNAGKTSYDYADTKTLKASQFGAGLVHNF